MVYLQGSTKIFTCIFGIKLHLWMSLLCLQKREQTIVDEIYVKICIENSSFNFSFPFSRICEANPKGTNGELYSNLVHIGIRVLMS